MIYVVNTPVGLLYYGGQPVSMVYYSTTLVWSSIRSCFGNGYWKADMPWVGADAWKSN